MAVLRDTFWEQFTAVLVPEGWVLTDGQRYDPTIINGLTPTGKLFTFTAVRNGDSFDVSIDVQGRTRSGTISAAELEDGFNLNGRIKTLWGALPASQR